MNRRVGGLVLAGGRSSRMGSAKALLSFGEKTLLEHVAGRLEPQVCSLVVNGRDDLALPSRWPVVTDIYQGFAGPLAGIHAGLTWFSRHESDIGHVAVIPVDVPFFPKTLIDDLSSMAETEDRFVLARSSSGPQPLAGLWPVSCLDDLDQWLRDGRSARVMAFLEGRPVTYRDFPDAPAGHRLYDPFFNINTSADVEMARHILKDIENG